MCLASACFGCKAELCGQGGLAVGLGVRRRLKQTLENETAFVAGVILLGFLPVALLVAALFVR